MKTFEEFKAEILRRAKKADACFSEYSKALASDKWSTLLSVIKSNSNWCYFNNLTPIELMRDVPKEELHACGIYVDNKNVEQKEGFAIYYSSTSKHYGSSTSEHYYSSTSEHYGSSTSEHYDSSTSKHYGSSTYGSVFILNDTSIVNDKAIVRERSTGKVFCKIDAFEVIQIGL